MAISPVVPGLRRNGWTDLRYGHNAVSDGDADAFYLVGIPSGGIRGLQQLVDERVLGIDFCGLVVETNSSKVRWRENTSEGDPAVSGVDFGGICYRWLLVVTRCHLECPNIPVPVLIDQGVLINNH